MIDGDAWAYGAVFLGSLILTLGLTPVAFRVARWRGWLDAPKEGKGHAEAMPYLGGAAMAIGFGLAVMIGSMLLSGRARGELSAILAAAVALSIVGLVDDLRGGLGPWTRLALEAMAAIVVWQVGSGVALSGQPVVDGVGTVFWILAVTNAFNLLDNVDGLSAGVASIAAAFFFLLAAINGQFLVATLAVGVAGCALAFLRHNFHPARIYMGDAGSLFLGFLLAVIGIKIRFVDAPRPVALFVPVLVLAVAFFDTTLVTVMRLLHRRSPFLGGLDHTSHRLLSLGLPVPTAVALIYAAAIGAGWLAVALSMVQLAVGLILIALALTVSGFFGILLAMIPVYETSRRSKVMLTRVPYVPDAEPKRAHS